MNKKYIIIAAVVLIIFAVIGKKAGWFGKKYITKIATEYPAKRTIVEIITANGRIQPETEVKISADVSGEIVELPVKEGQEVKEGDLLVKIKPDIYISAVQRAEASVNSAKSNLANSKARLAQVKAQFTQAELTYNRNKKLLKEGAISKAEFESAESQFLVAKAEVEAAEENVNSALFAVKSAEASLEEAKENLRKTTIYAPMSGTISKLNVEKGERVVGTIQMSGTEILRIANLNKMEVMVQVNENDIINVKLGDTAEIEVDAYLGRKFKGVVTEIANSANVSGSGTDQITNFDVKISVLRDSYKDLIPESDPNYYPFRPGMSATADIKTRVRYNVLSVPIQAVTTRTDSSGKVVSSEKVLQNTNDNNDKQNKETTEEEAEPKEVVFVYKDGKAIMKYVETGIQDNTYIEITKGLSEKDEVIVAPYHAISKKLKNNMIVEKTTKDELYKQE